MKRTPIRVERWSSDTAHGRQQRQDLSVLCRMLLRNTLEATVWEVLSLSDGSWERRLKLSPLRAEWEALADILSVLGPDYTRSQFTDAVDHASCFLYGPIGPEQAARYERWGKA